MDNSAKLIVSAFIALLFGAIAIGIMASNTNDKTTEIYVANETISLAPARVAGGGLNTTYDFTLTNAPTSWKTTDCAVDDLAYRNQTGATLTLTTHYTFTGSTGALRVKNVTSLNSPIGNSTAVSYSYCGDDYLNSTWGRSTLNMVSGFFALIMLSYAAGVFYLVFKQK